MFFEASIPDFSPSISDIEERKGWKDERRKQSEVDESSSEQYIRESDDSAVTFRKTWSPSASGTGSYSRQADENLVV